MRHAIKGLAVALFASGAAGFGYLPDGYDSLDNPGGYGYESFAGYCAIDGNDAGLGEGDEGRTDYADVSVSACGFHVLSGYFRPWILRHLYRRGDQRR